MTTASDPGRVKTLEAAVVAQQKNSTPAFDESFMRERQFVRINLAFERPAEGFSHSQDPKETLPPPRAERNTGQFDVRYQTRDPSPDKTIEWCHVNRVEVRVRLLELVRGRAIDHPASEFGHSEELLRAWREAFRLVEQGRL